MSELYIVWSDDPNKAHARLLLLTAGRKYRVLRRDRFELAQAEDLDVPTSIYGDDAKYAIVVEVE